MGKKLLQVFFFLSFIALNCSAEYNTKYDDDQTVYDPAGLFKKAAKNVHNSRRLKELNPLDNLRFQGVNEDFEFNSSSFLLQNSTCLSDLNYIRSNLKSEWALKMLDSYGKPESSLLLGNLRWNGDYNECIGIRASNPNSSEYGNFRGKYCTLTWTLKLFNLSLPSITSGLCIPDSCSAEELTNDTLQLLHMAGIVPNASSMESIKLKCKPTERHFDAGAIVMIVLLSTFFALSFVGSSITAVKYFKTIIEENKNLSRPSDFYKNDLGNADQNNILDNPGTPPDDEVLLRVSQTVTPTVPFLKTLKTFFGCFCMFTNGAKLLNTDSSEGDLLCIHGIRFLSMSWVIIGHTYAFGFGQMKNPRDIFENIDTFPFQAILQAFFSVDSFFVISGFLLTFLSMKELSRTKGKINWPYFYIHRYLRLTPMYMILLGFSATVYLYLGSGPYWPDGDYDVACRSNWWRNLLYINNFDLEAGQCMGWSWYLANDMQFFVVSPLFLMALYTWPKIGYYIIACFLFNAMYNNFIITYEYDMMNGIITLFNNGITDLAQTLVKFQEYFDKIYVKPYTRMGPYLVGILAGYILFRRKASNAPKHSLVFLIVGWIIASSVTLDTVYGLYHTHPNLIARSFYNAFSRICYAGGLSWVIYVCLVGQGGFVNRLLSFKLFIPLSRLTYAAYLIHPMVISGYFGSLKTSIEFTHTTIVTLFLGFMLVTYALALPVALILESPIVALEKLVRKAFTERKTTAPVN